MRLRLVLLVLSIVGFAVNPHLGQALLLIFLATLIKGLVPALGECVFGIRLRLPRVEEAEGQAAYLHLGRGRYRVGTMLRISEVRHNIYDLDAYDWASRCKAFIDDTVTDVDVDYKLIYVKKGSDMRYYVDVAVEGDSMGAIRDRLFDVLTRVRRNLEGLGLGTQVASREDVELVKDMLGLEPAKPRWWIPIALFLLGIYLLWRALGAFAIPCTLLMVCAGLIGEGLRRGERYRLGSHLLVVEEDRNAWRAVSVEEAYRSGVNLHSSVNLSPHDLMIVVSLRRTSLSEVEEYRHRYYRKVKWGEAMGKYEWIDESERYRGLVERADRGEGIYKCEVSIYVKSERALNHVKSLLESNAMACRVPLVKGKHIRIF